MIYYLDRENSKCVADCICQRWRRPSVPFNILYLSRPIDTPSLILSKTLWWPMKTSGSDAQWLLRLGHKIATQFPPILLGYLLLLFIFHAVRKPRPHGEKQVFYLRAPSEFWAHSQHQPPDIYTEMPPDDTRVTPNLWVFAAEDPDIVGHKQAVPYFILYKFVLQSPVHNKMLILCHQFWRWFKIQQ